MSLPLAKRWLQSLRAAAAHRKARRVLSEGDCETAVATLRRAFDRAPHYGERAATRFVTTFKPRRRRSFWQAPPQMFADPSNLKQTFDTIYSRAVWGGGSGGGSDVKAALIYLAYVQHFLDRHAIRSIVDLGCGDWRFSKYLDLSGRTYLGVDIVGSVIAANRAAYGSATISFQEADITQFDVGECDLLLCKDVLQHLSNEHVQEILDRSRKARFALFTNDYHPSNDDNENGSTRPLDITRAPFAVEARPRLAFSNKVTFLVANAVG